MAQSLTEALTDAARAATEASDWERNREAWNLPRAARTSNPEDAVRMMSGRFEAQFEQIDAAKAAARDARAVGFVVDVRQDDKAWLAVGRRELSFPADERDRYANRFRSIATQHSGTFLQFVEETQAGGADGK